jgi:hypothetical protein
MFSLYNQGWRSAYSCITLKNQFYGGLYSRLKKPKGSRILPDSFLWQRFCEDNRYRRLSVCGTGILDENFKLFFFFKL